MLHAELSESIQRGDAALCIGAGLSMGAGIPGWTALLRPLAKALGVRMPDDADLTGDRLIAIAQHYENQMGRNALISHLRKMVDITGVIPTSIHHLLAFSPVRVMFTTNYDSLLEQALREAGRRVNVSVSESDLAFWHEDEAQVVKLCGDISRPESIVITQRDFNTYQATHARLAERLRNILESNTVLILGYNSMQDPFFNQIWDSIGLNFGSLRRQGFAVLFDAEPLEIDNLRYRGIQAINLETAGKSKSLVLERWLSTLLGPHLVRAGSDTKGEVDGIESANPTYGTGRRWAVLVGINEYEDSANYGPLQVCVSDAEAIQKKLVAGGFEQQATFPLTGTGGDGRPSRENMLATLKSVADATDQDDLLLFYYSGHGDVQGNESYLVAQNGRAIALEDTAVPLTRVKEILEQAPARAKVIILDACHSGANIGGKGPKRMSREFIQHVFEQAEGLAILASCKYHQLSYEWRDQGCSVFTNFLLEALDGLADQDKKGFVTVQDVNRYIVNGVKLWAAQHKVVQTPTLQYEVAGDIILSAY